MGQRHFDESVDKMCSELPHGIFLAVNKERTFRSSLFLPSQQLRLVGVGREPIDGVDASPNWNILAQNVHLLGAVDDAARERPNSCVANKHDARVLATDIVLNVVEHAAAGAHARTGHNDGTTMDAVYRNGFGGFPREMQTW
jgi:hypothetical protein